MRLLDTATLRLVQIADSEISLTQNAYAILSHRWGSEEDEVTFSDMADQKIAMRKAGYAKLQGLCKVVASLGYRYTWADTCCINKESSSELAEAINSMYLWYSDRICIAYLADVPAQQIVQSDW